MVGLPRDSTPLISTMPKRYLTRWRELVSAAKKDLSHRAGQRRTKIELKTAKVRPERAAISSCRRRRGDRITTSFAASHYVRFWHKADILHRVSNVRFWG